MTTATEPLITRKNDAGETVQMKNIYASALQRLGSTLVKFKTGAKQSKYPKNGCTMYTYLELPDGLEYSLSLEPHLADPINAAPMNEWVRLHVGGSFDTPTTISISAENNGADGINGEYQDPSEPIAPPSPQPATPAQVPAPTPAPTVNGTTGPDLFASAWEHGKGLVNRDFPAASDGAKLDAVCRVASTLFIQAARR